MTEFTIRDAGPRDVETLTALVNKAFEVEEFFKQGDRTSSSAVRALFDTGVMLIADGREASAVGSVYVEPRGDRVYIGMVSVDPLHQGRGIGRLLMEAAEDYGRSRGCSFSDITVVNLRTELPPFYRKLGYVETGTVPFPDPETASRPCHLITMSKRLKPSPAEVWLRGSIAGVAQELMPVVHSLMQVREEIEAIVPTLSSFEMSVRPGGAASIAFHLRHLAGSLDRLLTYARGEPLTPAQRDFLNAENSDGEESAEKLLELALQAIDDALKQARATPVDTLPEPRRVGRAELPSTVLGLLFHAAEHAQRHAGQIATTARIVMAARSRSLA